MTMRCGRLVSALLLVAALAPRPARAVSWAEQSAVKRALYTGIAVVANLVPGVSAIYAPRCLPGYILCKVTFAGVSLVAAADQLLMSGGADLTQTRGILYRGFEGDWVLTPAHVAGDRTPRPLPDPPPPPSEGGEGGWQPPPI
ncbi:MAG TPA: hypothetical protein VFD84_12660 [Candidatus Binatia bacterium]|jgi:hypothetical protein|nr:hypothetical protein [Candidatus Binatia bacterium]